MIIDSKGKLFGKVSIIDILIVLVVIAGVAGVGYKLAQSKTILPFTAKTDKIVMTFYWDESPDYAVKAVKKGDLVRDFDRGTVLGKVIEDVEIKDAISEFLLENGEWAVGSKPGYCSYYMTIEGTGVINDIGGLTFGGAEYYVGRQLTLKAGNAVFQGRLYSFEKKE